MQHFVSNSKEKLRKRFSKISLGLIFISFLFLAIIIFVATGTFFFEFGYKWAIFSLDIWIYLFSIILLFFIIFEFSIFVTYNLSRKNNKKMIKPKIEYIGDKRVYVFICPSQAEGGIFSKTYISIDKKYFINVKCLMVPPGELWSAKQDITL